MADDSPTLEPDSPAEHVADAALEAAKTAAADHDVTLRSVIVLVDTRLPDGKTRGSTAATGERYDTDDEHTLAVELLTDLLLRAKRVAKSLGKNVQIHTLGEG